MPIRLRFYPLHLLLILLHGQSLSAQPPSPPDRPNILFAISDDQSFPHTSFAGCSFVATPAFDRVARTGVYFANCMAGSPGCAPSRSSIVTGRYHWQNQQAGQHASGWLKKYVPFVDVLAADGYYVGRTGKGVSPFKYGESEADSLRVENAAGKAFNEIRYEEGAAGDERFADHINAINYAANFRAFLEQRPDDRPFFFWYGATEPHRAYEEGAGRRHGKTLADADVPTFYPDVPAIRNDLLDYALEIEWFDLHLQRMIDYLEETGELDNTIIIVTSDNGMPFPRAKALCYEYGIHVPMTVSYPEGIPGGRTVTDPISFVDLAPTILELTGTSPAGMLPMSGRSFAPLLRSEKEDRLDPDRKYVFAGRERHSSSRYRNAGYPQRAVRSADYLLIWNLRPERWPAGAPQRLVPGTTDEVYPLYGIDENGVHHSEWAFTDVDAAPTKAFLIEQHRVDSIAPFFQLSYGKLPEFQLFDIRRDPDCLHNLIGDPDYQAVEKELQEVLLKELVQSKDPRIVGPDKGVFDTYKRYSPMREFPKE